MPATVDPDRRDYRRPGSRGAYHRRVLLVESSRFTSKGDRVQAGALLVVLESTDISRTRAELRSVQARAQAAANATRLEAVLIEPLEGAGEGGTTRGE